MKNKCPKCKLVNYPNVDVCARCGVGFAEISAQPQNGSKILRRACICIFVCAAALAGFYVSLLFSASSLSYEQKVTVKNAIAQLENTGFANEAFLLKRIAVFRADDNWLNSTVAKENAFAATNFPFEIVTLYADFFTYPVDETERAAILLHEARHLRGEDEKEAYEFVWKNRTKLGWTSEKYATSVVWSEIRKQTRHFAPNLFVCDANPFGDCTE